MKTVIAVFLTALLSALLTFALGSQDYVNVIWAVGLALVVADLELAGISFLVLSGFLFDIMILGNVGVTSASAVIGVGVYILAKGLGITDRLWQKVLWVLVALLVTFGVNAIVGNVLSGRYLGVDLLDYWFRSVLINAVLVGGVYALISWMKVRFGGTTTVKL